MEQPLGNLYSEVTGKMDYAKLAEGIFSALGAEEDVDPSVESEISDDAKANTEKPSLKSSWFSSPFSKMLGAISAGGIIVGLIGVVVNRVYPQNLQHVYALLGVGAISFLVLIGMMIPNYRAKNEVKKAEALVRATERYIKQQAERQEAEEESEAEVEKAAEQTEAAKIFFSDNRTGMGLTVDFSNPFNLSGAMGNIGDFDASSGRNTGVSLVPNHSSQKFKWL